MSAADTLLADIRAIEAQEPDSDKSLDLVYDRVDSWMWMSWWRDIDDLLSRINPNEWPPTLALSFLTITWPAAPHLSQRSPYAKRLRAHFSATRSVEEIDDLLRGLEEL